MNFSKEQIAKAQLAKSVEDLITIAQGEGIELSEQNAKSYFEFLNGNNALSENDLDLVAGGKGKPEPPEPKYHAGQRCLIWWPSTMNYTPGVITLAEKGVYDPQAGTRYQVLVEVKRGDNVIEIPQMFYLETMPQTVVYD